MKNICTILAFLILPFALYSQYCLPNGIIFHTQAEIDSFHINYPDCSIIGYDVLIQEEIAGKIKNLDSLIGLTKIEGDLIISDNDSLQGLSGLDSLELVYSLMISNNSALADLTALSGLNSLHGACQISGNASLTSLNGLNNITEIRGTLFVMDNDSLDDLTGLESLTFVNWHVHIGSTYPGGNPSVITSLSGLSNLYDIGGELLITNFSHLIDLNGLNNLHYIGRDLVIMNNDSLSSLTGLENLTDLYDGALTIQMNPCLTSMNGLNNLDIVYGSFTCSDNFSLESLDGLENLDRIHGHLVLYNNPVLSNISALSSLFYTGEIIKIVENDSLISLEGLDNIEPGSFSLLLLTNNFSLCNCSVKSVCDYLDGVNVNTIIHDNAPGCNSQAEIETTCDVGLSESSVVGRQSSVWIYPNPATDQLIVSIPITSEIEHSEFEILNYNGILVKSGRITSFLATIDIQGLSVGLYLLRINDGKTQITARFVKR